MARAPEALICEGGEYLKVSDVSDRILNIAWRCVETLEPLCVDEHRPAPIEVPVREAEVGPFGKCPRCEARIPLRSQVCPKCEANFGEGAAWGVIPE